MRYLPLLPLVLLFAACESESESESESGLIVSGSTTESVDEVAGTAARGGVIAGRVVDAQGEGVSMASVVVRGAGVGSATDREGRFVLIGVAAGTHTLHASAAGYRADSVAVDVAMGDTTRTDIALD